MGQYWYPVNLDKKEYVDPHKLGSGLKLGEQLSARPGTGSALVILCAAMPGPRGGGDLDLALAARTIGRWAGDRIALVGDYAEDGDLPAEFMASTIYERCQEGAYTDISADVARVIEHEMRGRFVGDGWKQWVPGGKDA